jgi:hypothetical protein
MKPAGWRALLLGMCSIAALLAIAEVFFEYGGPNSTSTVGQWGDTVGPSSQPFHLFVLSTDPGHGADLAGLRPGDLIDIRANAPVERFWLLGQPPTGRSVTVLALRGTSQHAFTVVTQPITPLRRMLLTPIWVGFVWIALFAGVIAWRRSDDVQMRTLCLLLVTYAFWETTNQHYITSDSWSVLAAAAGFNVLGTLTVAFWAACAGSFVLPRSPLRIATQWLCYALVGTSIAIGLTRIAGIVTLRIDPIAFGSSAAAVPFVIALLAAAACTVLAVSASQGAERQRAIWSLLPAGALIVVGFGAESLQGVVKSYDIAWSVYYVASALNIVTPLILTYVALSRRLLDIGFVLNRAAVYAIVSATLIAAFVIVEWIANEWLSVNHTTSAIVGMLVALALGLSMRYIHRFADRFVDRVFFRKRHDDEAALLRFSHEAAYITDRPTLLERALRTVKSSTGAEASILLLDDGTSRVDENDPALVALRTWHKPLDLETFPESALHGQFAFPMVARGTLLGVLVCGSKKDCEVYAPDESAALFALAHGVGSALSLLSAARADLSGSLSEAIAELRVAISDLRDLKK